MSAYTWGTEPLPPRIFLSFQALIGMGVFRQNSRRKGRAVLLAATADPIPFKGWQLYIKVTASIVAADACVKTKCSDFNQWPSGISGWPLTSFCLHPYLKTVLLPAKGVNTNIEKRLQSRYI